MNTINYLFVEFFGLINRSFAQVFPPSPTIINPLKAKSIVGLIAALANVIFQIGVPVVAVAIIYSGFLFIKAQGNESKLSEAKQVFYWTMIGAAIVLGAVVISEVINTTVTSLK